MSAEVFFRFALTEPYTAVRALDLFPEPQRGLMTFVAFGTLLQYSFGGRIPTRRERRQAVDCLTRDLGRSYRKEIKALVAIFDEAPSPYSAPKHRSYQLMIHIAAATCARADFNDAQFHKLIAGLVDLMDIAAIEPA